MTNSLTDSLKTGRSFDDKLYNYLKNESTEEKITFDDIYPVGSIVRSRYNSPPSKGTWEMVGIHGTYSYDDSAHHWLTFNGKIADDYMRVDPSTETLVSVAYTYLLGNDYRILTPHNLMINTEPLQVFSGSVTGFNSKEVGLLFYLESAHDLNLTKPSDNTGMACSIRIRLGSLSDVSQTVLNDENILVEYKRIK